MPFSQLNITVNYVDGTSEVLSIQSPNQRGGFKHSIFHIGGSIYEDMGKALRKGSGEKRVKLILGYSSHDIDVRKIIISDNIQFDFSDYNLPFLNTVFKFSGRSIKRNWKSSLVNSVVPHGELQMEFHSIDEYQINELYK